MELISNGKAKKIYAIENDLVEVEYKDSMSAFNGRKVLQFEHKGELNCEITTKIYKYLNANNVTTHFVKQISANKQICQKLQMLGIEFVCRNQISGSLASRLNLEKNAYEIEPVIEIYFKNDELDDPYVNDDIICKVLKICSFEELNYMKQQTLKINKLLQDVFTKLDLTLIDFKIEFGKNHQNEIVLGDEISPDSCRIVTKTNQHYDKQYFRDSGLNPLHLYKKLLEELSYVI